MKCAIGVVGLGVMGANLARNMESRGFAVAGYDLDAAKTTAFAAGEGRRVVGAGSAAALADVLERPRKILMMVGR
jgi:6-phosphogluconate dehydrogenase